MGWVIRFRTHTEKGPAGNIVLHHSGGSTIALGRTLDRRRRNTMMKGSYDDADGDDGSGDDDHNDDVDDETHNAYDDDDK